MKKTLFALAALALVAVSCKKDGGDDTAKETPLEATLELTTEVAELPYGEPFEVTGTVTTTATLDSYVLTAVKKVAEGEYVAVGEAQTFAAEGNEMKVEYFADSKDMTDLEIVLKAGAQEAKFYFSATATGELKGTFWMNDAAMLAATPKVGTNDNDPETYPVAGTGAGSDIPSFFSMRGGSFDGDAIANEEGITAVEGGSGRKTTVTYKLEAGTYYFTAAAFDGIDTSESVSTTIGEYTDTNKAIAGRDIRVYTISIE